MHSRKQKRFRFIFDLWPVEEVARSPLYQGGARGWLGGGILLCSIDFELRMATDSVELLALQRIDETCMQLQQQASCRREIYPLRAPVPHIIFTSTLRSMDYTTVCDRYMFSSLSVYFPSSQL